jgi:hypothetical protein
LYPGDPSSDCTLCKFFSLNLSGESLSASDELSDAGILESFCREFEPNFSLSKLLREDGDMRLLA